MLAASKKLRNFLHIFSDQEKASFYSNGLSREIGNYFSTAIYLFFTAFIQSKEAGIKTLVALDDQGGKYVL